MEPIDSAFTYLLNKQAEDNSLRGKNPNLAISQYGGASYHPSIHGFMRRKKLADQFNAEMGPMDDSLYAPNSIEEEWTGNPNSMTREELEDMAFRYKPSDFLEEANVHGYEPKGAAEKDPMDPNTLEAMERRGELKRQSMGLAPRDVELRKQNVGNSYDLTTYINEATKQLNEKRKKQKEDQKLRDEIMDHEAQGQIYQYYKENHPEFMQGFMAGGQQ